MAPNPATSHQRRRNLPPPPPRQHNNSNYSINPSNPAGKKREKNSTNIFLFGLALGALLSFAFLFIIRECTNSNHQSESVSSTGTVVSDVSTTQPQPSKVKQQHPMDSYIKNMKGPPNTWELVDWTNPISEEETSKFSCNMIPFTSAKSGVKSQICIHTFPDVIGKHIGKYGNWGDCKKLVRVWDNDGKEEDDNSLYIEIGTNIGSCVMEMLLSTNARIIAFEPHPMNVYNIKRTVSQMANKYQDRLLLFPIGLGSAANSSTIYSGHDNMGNSVIGAQVKDWGHQRFDKHLQYKVFVDRLDSVIDAAKIDNVRVRLIKMDCQGYECNAVEGMQSFKGKIQHMMFEYAAEWLKSQGCTDLVARVQGLGFQVYKYGSTKILHSELDIQIEPAELIAKSNRLDTN